MNLAFKSWLESHGFRRVLKSCRFQNSLSKHLCVVWLHSHGGQAEILDYTGHRIARLESWKDTAELVTFFGLETREDTPIENTPIES